jgi:4'-phosphopantetheinyl transferase
MSHCREAAICAISEAPVGIDVESIREYRESLVHYTMNDDEIAEITQSPNPALAFIRYWTMKEAVLKLSGEGIRNDLKTVLIGFANQIQTIVNEPRGYVYSVVY